MSTLRRCPSSISFIVLLLVFTVLACTFSVLEAITRQPDWILYSFSIFHNWYWWGLLTKTSQHFCKIRPVCYPLHEIKINHHSVTAPRWLHGSKRRVKSSISFSVYNPSGYYQISVLKVKGIGLVNFAQFLMQLRLRTYVISVLAFVLRWWTL